MLSKWLLKDPVIHQAYQTGKSFFIDYAEKLSRHREGIKERLELKLREFTRSLSPAKLPTQHLSGLVSDTSDYVKWLGWSLDDIGYFSLSLEIEPQLIYRRIVACHFVYQSGRLFDDLIDGHNEYKGLKVTSLGARKNYWKTQEGEDYSEKECTLIALTLLLKGIRDYSTCFGSQIPTEAIVSLLHTVSNACLGALIELNEEIPPEMDSYVKLVELKTSAHNAILLQPFWGLIPEAIYQQLKDFYQQSSLTGQILNDAIDIEEDTLIGQINYFNFSRSSQTGTKLSGKEAAHLTGIIQDLALRIGKLHPRLQPAAYAKFSTIIDRATHLEVSESL